MTSINFGHAKQGKTPELGIRIKTKGGLKGFLSKILRPLRMRWQGQRIEMETDRYRRGVHTDTNESIL